MRRAGKLVPAQVGQSITEMALVLPIMLLLVFGVFELGRVVFIFSALNNASREAARFGAATGITESNTAHYLDCAAIREQARETAFLAGLSDDEIQIAYDRPSGNQMAIFAHCGDADLDPSDIAQGDRIVVTVTRAIAPVVPFLPTPTFAPTFVTARSILKEIAIGPVECSDGFDNDGDGLIDYPDDPGCSGPDDTTEAFCYRLSVSTAPIDGGNLSIVPGSNCANRYRERTTVHLEAFPTERYKFRRWSGSHNTMDNPTSVVMDSDKDIVAEFVLLMADLVVSKSASPEPVGAGNPIDYSITVNNPMTDTARDLVITDTLPAGVVYQGFTSTKAELTCTETPPGIVCELPELPVGDGVTVDLEVLAPIVSGASETITNTATASAFEHDPKPDNNTWSVTTEVVPRAEMSVLEKTSSATTVDAGTEFNYTISVRNDGPSAATGVVIEDILPVGIEVIGSSECLNNPLGSGTITCEVADMPVDTEVTVTLNVRAPDEGSVDPLTNTATVSANEMENDGGDNDDDANTTIESVADLRIEKTGPANATRDVPFSYNLTITNTGPSTAENVVVTDDLPAGLRFEDNSSPECSASGSVVTCNLGNMAASATVNLTIAVTPLEASDEPLLNQASVASNTTDRNFDNNESDFVSTSVTVDTGLFISKSASQGTVSDGDPFTYNIEAGNNGPSNATGVTLVDPLPDGVELVSVVPSVDSWDCGDGQEVHCTPADGVLVADQNATFVVTVEAVEPGTFENTATLSANEDEVSDGATVTIQPSLDLSVTKTPSSDTATVGTPFGYNLTIDNTGPSTATFVTVVDTLPDGVSNVSVPAEPTSWLTCSYDDEANNITCTAEEFVSGTATIPISVTPTIETPDPMVNTATITAEESQFDTDPDNDSVSVSTPLE